MSTPEGLIENAIFRYLRMRGVFAFKVKTQGTWDPTKKLFRKLSANSLKGVSDILGIYNGRFLAIEVKSAKGVLTTEQKAFLQAVLENGGIAFVARSPEDVHTKLEHWRSA